MIEYTVKVYRSGTKYWYLNDELHREDGPAVQCANGTKYWYLNGEEFTKKEWRAKLQPQPNWVGKVVEIDGKKYKLTEV
tara:strand:+ start:3446 stop:3682 length:237 start_codon:yes stop_codon:yes gene_type:complete